MPDDWNNYYSKCAYCGRQVHASEGGCGCLDDAEQCEGCGGGRRAFCETLAEAEGWHPIEDLTEVAGKFYCTNHLVCECCEEGPDSGDEENHNLMWNEDTNSLVCPKCTEEKHFCAASGPLLDHVAKALEEEE